MNLAITHEKMSTYYHVKCRTRTPDQNYIVFPESGWLWKELYDSV